MIFEEHIHTLPPPLPRAIFNLFLLQGLGLYAARDIEKHTMVIEYIGTIIRNEVANRKEKLYESQVSASPPQSPCHLRAAYGGQIRLSTRFSFEQKRHPDILVFSFFFPSASPYLVSVTICIDTAVD